MSTKPRQGVHTRSAEGTEYSAEELQVLAEQVQQKERRLREQEQRAEQERQALEKRLQESQLRLDQERDDLTQERTEMIQEHEQLRSAVQNLMAEVRELRSRPVDPDRTSFHQPPNEGRARIEEITREFLPGPSQISTNSEVSSGIHKRVKEAADGIQTFDGMRQLVIPFCESCYRARDYLPSSDEPLLVRTILNKLRGQAYRIVGRSQFNSVSELCNKIRKLFSPFKSANYYRGELSRTFQTPNQSVLDFAIKIRELRDLIMDGDQQRYGTLDHRTELEIQKEASEAFIQGLLPDIATRLRIEGYDTLDDAIEKAIKIHTEIQDEHARFRRGYEQHDRNPRYRNYDRNADPRHRTEPPKPERPREDKPRYGNNNYGNGSNYLNNYNNGNGYRGRNERFDTSRPNNYNDPGKRIPEKQCRYCKNPGHTIEECRKLKARREYEQNQQRPGNTHGPSPNRVGQGPSNQNRGTYPIARGKNPPKDPPVKETSQKQKEDTDQEEEEIPEEGMLSPLFE
ncbi:trichohyalin-like [Colletes gigas]|uniref:trichohyalin-like n=1 Tax=Colletes gigas TaxID=935657 RepID=UPI001C9B5EB0|nr:trichohyalin-like [Colletes gigas]